MDVTNLVFLLIVHCFDHEFLLSILKNNCANNEIIISGKAADGNAAVITNGGVNDKDHDFEESSMDTMSCRY